MPDGVLYVKYLKLCMCSVTSDIAARKMFMGFFFQNVNFKVQMITCGWRNPEKDTRSTFLYLLDLECSLPKSTWDIC